MPILWAPQSVLGLPLYVLWALRDGWDVPFMTYVCHGWEGRQKVSRMGRPNRDLDGTFFNIDPVVSRMGRPNRDFDGTIFNIVPVLSWMGHPSHDTDRTLYDIGPARSRLGHPTREWDGTLYPSHR